MNKNERIANSKFMKQKMKTSKLSELKKGKKKKYQQQCGNTKNQ